MSGNGRKKKSGGGKKKKSGGNGGKKKSASASASSSASAEEANDGNAAALAALRRLSEALSELDGAGGGGGAGSLLGISADGSGDAGGGDTDGGGDTSGGASDRVGLPLSHYRPPLPPTVASAYKMIDDGSQLVRATSTKYTLVGKIDPSEGAKMASDLRRGCEINASGVLVLHSSSAGCSRSARVHARRVGRGVVTSVLRLVEAFADGTAGDGNVGARLTGAVWGACDAATKMPRGNRNAMRRDMLTWTAECTETMEEFEEMVRESREAEMKGPAPPKGPPPAIAEEEDDDDNERGAGGGGDEGSAAATPPDRQTSATWDEFCDAAGTGETYSSHELPAVGACVGLIKCSRGTVKTAMEGCEAAASALTASSEGGGEDDKEKGRREREEVLQWISDLHELSRTVGEGATELGALLYPPLDVVPISSTTKGEEKGEGQEGEENANDQRPELLRRIEMQTCAVVAVHDHILDAAFPANEKVPSFEGIREHAERIRTAAGRRAEEAAEAARELMNTRRGGNNT